MTTSTIPEPHTPSGNYASFFRGRTFFYLMLAIAAGYYLWGWHKEHVLQYWPFAIYLLCPLMHIFMHGGHRHRDEPRTEKAKESCH